jgi:RHS repeat-associated protein
MDTLGSTIAITDGEDKVLEANVYGPFGEMEFSYKATLHKVNPEKRAELLVDPFLYSSDNRYMYTGQEQDEFGGLLYYNARWYDPEVGRFISEDPAAANPNDPLSINRYIYCRNNPLIYTDPTGEIFGIDDFVFILICAVVAGIGNAVDAMTNPKNEWHGGNYNDAFWSGFWKGAKVGSTIVAINNIIEGFCEVTRTADGVGSNTQPDLAQPSSETLQRPTPGNNGIPDAGTVQPNATVNGSAAGDMTKFEVPVEGYETSGWLESRGTDLHKGIDYGVPKGTSVKAALGGKVNYVGTAADAGNFIVVDHGNGLSTQYSHLSEILVKEGQSVVKGARIGLSGSTGISTGPHLDFKVFSNGLNSVINIGKQNMYYYGKYNRWYYNPNSFF